MTLGKISHALLHHIPHTIFLGLIIVYWIHSQYHLDIVVTPAPSPAEAALISICIPARNEENNIRRCVEAALDQDHPNIEIIVLDDCSTDATLTRSILDP